MKHCTAKSNKAVSVNQPRSQTKKMARLTTPQEGHLMAYNSFKIWNSFEIENFLGALNRVRRTVPSLAMELVPMYSKSPYAAKQTSIDN